MKLPEKERMTADILMLWVMHQFADVFREHALLKGGMQLMLLSSDRATNDLDYVFTPFHSKKELEPEIDRILAQLPDAEVQKSFHSHMGRYLVKVGQAQIQIEYNVAESVDSAALTTQLLAGRLGFLPKVIRVMSSDVAFAHKLAAWNERRLVRDLYDIFYWFAQVKAMPNQEILEGRLNAVNSRLPSLKKIKKMTLTEFLDQLEHQVKAIEEETFQEQLGPLLPPQKIEGLLPVFKTQLFELILLLRRPQLSTAKR